MSDIHSGHDVVDTSCPNCGDTTAAVEVTVHSGIWERLFLRCSSCHRGLVAAWTNTHEKPTGRYAVGAMHPAGA